jgi:16S rRNA G966 N2-methylase RsmD
VFVERHRSAIKIIKENRDVFEVSDEQARLEYGPALRIVRDLARRDEIFDVAWADPPFEHWEEGLEAVVVAFDGGVIRRDGIACLECPEKARLELPESLEIERDLRGGASRLVLLARTPES